MMKDLIQFVPRLLGYEVRKRFAVIERGPQDPGPRSKRLGLIDFFGHELYQDIEGTDYSRFAGRGFDQFIAGEIRPT